MYGADVSGAGSNNSRQTFENIGCLRDRRRSKGEYCKYLKVMLCHVIFQYFYIKWYDFSICIQENVSWFRPREECENPCKFYLEFLCMWSSIRQVKWDVKLITEFAGAWGRKDRFPCIMKMGGITWCSKAEI